MNEHRKQRERFETQRAEFAPTYKFLHSHEFVGHKLCDSDLFFLQIIQTPLHALQLLLSRGWPRSLVGHGTLRVHRGGGERGRDTVSRVCVMWFSPCIQRPNGTENCIVYTYSTIIE